MLLVFFGNSIIEVRGAAFKEIDKDKQKGVVMETISTDNFSAEMLVDLASGSSLFGTETLYLLDTPSNSAEVYEKVIEGLPLLAESAHKFVIIEGALLAPVKKKFAKHAEVCEEFKTAAAQRFNTFAAADAFAKKDKRTLWMLLSEAREEGIADEEIIGIIWWQIKAMRLAEQTASAKDAGMKDWPYNKAKQSLGNFKDGELMNLSNSLLDFYHQSRTGKVDMDIALEKWILSLK